MGVTRDLRKHKNTPVAAGASHRITGIYRRIPYDEPIPWEYEIVLSAFRKKRRQLELRRAYAEIIFAPNEDKRFDARMRYLQKKRHITDG